MLAIVTASRPTTWSAASIKCQPCSISPLAGMVVDIDSLSEETLTLEKVMIRGRPAASRADWGTDRAPYGGWPCPRLCVGMRWALPLTENAEARSAAWPRKALAMAPNRAYPTQVASVG